MKKIILSLMFVLATSLNFVNASSFDKIENIQTNNSKEVAASCLLIAYNQVEALEAMAGARFPFDQWQKVFTTLFESCNDTEQGIRVIFR